MPAISAEVTTGALQAFADAWNRHDADALMSFMTDDCVFEASAGTRSVASDMLAMSPYEPALQKFGQPSPTPLE
jgi:ketosteroid isomerase-like protein